MRLGRWHRSCQPEMSDHGCIHLNNFKAAKGIQPYKVIHSYFVTSTSTEARIRKVRPSSSRVLIVIKLFQGILPTHYLRLCITLARVYYIFLFFLHLSLGLFLFLTHMWARARAHNKQTNKQTNNKHICPLAHSNSILTHCQLLFQLYI